jgi:hypothetical protein
MGTGLQKLACAAPVIDVRTRRADPGHRHHDCQSQKRDVFSIEKPEIHGRRAYLCGIKSTIRICQLMVRAEGLEPSRLVGPAF